MPRVSHRTKIKGIKAHIAQLDISIISLCQWRQLLNELGPGLLLRDSHHFAGLQVSMMQRGLS